MNKAKINYEEEVKKKAREHFEDEHKVDLWYRIWNPILGASPEQLVGCGRGEYLLNMLGGGTESDG